MEERSSTDNQIDKAGKSHSGAFSDCIDCSESDFEYMVREKEMWMIMVIYNL